jgi:hypothetical protein
VLISYKGRKGLPDAQQLLSVQIIDGVVGVPVIIELLKKQPDI